MSTLIAFERLLEETRPETLILVSDDSRFLDASQGPTLWHATGDAAWRTIDSAPRAQLAVIDAEASIPNAEAALITGRLRDVYADRVVVAGPVNESRALNRQVLMSLGFHQIGHSEDASGDRHWYQFDIDNYKVTPDWLNPRHWANPELWDKYRW